MKGDKGGSSLVAGLKHHTKWLICCRQLEFTGTLLGFDDYVSQYLEWPDDGDFAYSKKRYGA